MIDCEIFAPRMMQMAASMVLVWCVFETLGGRIWEIILEKGNIIVLSLGKILFYHFYFGLISSHLNI